MTLRPTCTFSALLGWNSGSQAILTLPNNKHEAISDSRIEPGLTQSKVLPIDCRCERYKQFVGLFAGE